MKITKHILVLVTAISIVGYTFGQKKHNGDRKAHKEKIKTMKIGYITDKLELTSAEAQKFWPIYNEFDAKMNEFRKKRKNDNKKDNAELNNAELEKMITNRFEVEQQQLNLKKDYHIRFKSVLPLQKVAKLYKAELSFKRELLKKMRVRKGDPNYLNIPPPVAPPAPPAPAH